MKIIKRQISVLLAVMLILSSLTAISFSASAAETGGGKITVKSNICEPQVYDYTANDKQVEVTYYLASEYLLLNMQFGVYYDDSVLKLADSNTVVSCIPNFTSGNYIANLNFPDKALFNATSLGLYNFRDKGVFFNAVFDIIGSGDAEINLDVQVLTATTADSALDVANAEDVALVAYENVNSDLFTFESEANIIKDETKVVKLFGDLDYELEATDDADVYSLSVDLEKGDYSFRIMNKGVQYCCGYTFTDMTKGCQYNSKWTKESILKASGGTYTFKYNTATNILVIDYRAPSLASLFGDINLELEATKDPNVYSSSIDLEAGSYIFRVMNQGVRYCCGYTFNDITKGSQFNSKWTKESILKASGGTYTISYDIETNKLTILYAPEGAKCSITGDLMFVLEETSTENVYSVTKEIEEGSYQIKVSDFGQVCGAGVTINNVTTGFTVNSNYLKYATFNAKGGTYTFTYNAATNVLTIKNIK